MGWGKCTRPPEAETPVTLARPPQRGRTSGHNGAGGCSARQDLLVRRFCRQWLRFSKQVHKRMHPHPIVADAGGRHERSQSLPHLRTNHVCCGPAQPRTGQPRLHRLNCVDCVDSRRHINDEERYGEKHCKHEHVIHRLRIRPSMMHQVRCASVVAVQVGLYKGLPARHQILPLFCTPLAGTAGHGAQLCGGHVSCVAY